MELLKSERCLCTILIAPKLTLFLLLFDFPQETPAYAKVQLKEERFSSLQKNTTLTFLKTLKSG